MNFLEIGNWKTHVNSTFRDTGATTRVTDEQLNAIYHYYVLALTEGYKTPTSDGKGEAELNKDGWKIVRFIEEKTGFQLDVIANSIRVLNWLAYTGRISVAKLNPVANKEEQKILVASVGQKIDAFNDVQKWGKVLIVVAGVGATGYLLSKIEKLFK